VKPVPYTSRGLEFGELVIRRAGRKELPAVTDHQGSSRVVREAGYEADIAGPLCVALKAGATQAVDDPGLKERAPCRSLAAESL